MLKLLDENKKQIALLKYVEDYRIESSLKTGNKTLTFYYSKDNAFYDYIKEESYIKTKTDEFIIKARSTEEEETSFICELNLENLEGVPFDRFESIEQPITAALNLAIVGTGWTVKENNINKKRTVRMTDCSSLDIVQEIIKVYRVDIVFDTLNKQIKVYNELGSDKGTYLIEDLNLKKLGIQSDSYNYATRIKARGKDGLTFASINGGKDYVENYQYTKKIKTIFWSDDRYTIKESLLEDAKEKLNEISKPLVSYAATIKNLALLNPIYKNILDYSLGDIITLISKSNKLKDKQRIVKIIEYPMDHSRDTVELANSTLSFEDLQTEFQDTTDTVNNITTDNGTVDGSTIDGITTKQIEDFEANVIKVTNLKAVYAEIETLKVGKADIQNLNAVTARIGTLESTKANITDLTSTNIKVANLEANKATITDLNAASGKISVLESKTASIDNLLAGNLTANNFKANSIVAGSGIIADGAIGDAQISSLNANKMRAGTLDTSLVTVCGPQGRLKILGNKLQIFDDVNNKLFERIMLGINENNRASLTLRGSDGQTVLLTEEGLTKAGITDGFNKADDNSLNASKFDKNSIVRQVNGATESINGTRVQVGDRSLDIELSTQKNTITNNSKELSSQRATIKALDNAIKLKVDTQTYTNSINAINNNISTINSNLSKATSELNILKGEVSSKVSQSDIDKSIEDIKIGGRNLLPLNALYPTNGATGTFDKKTNTWTLIATPKSTSWGRGLAINHNIIIPFGCGAIYSFELKVPRPISWMNDVNNKPISGSAWAGNDNDNTSKRKTSTRTITTINEWIKCWIYIENTSSLNINKLDITDSLSNVGIVTTNESENVTFKIRNFKVELGNKATDWTPAPEDIDNLITENKEKISTVESSLVQKTDSIKANVRDLNSTTQSITTNINNINRDLNNKIDSNLDIAKNYTNAQISTVNTKVNNVESSLSILSEKISTKVSQSDIDKSVSELKFGGRNLWLNTGFSDGTNYFGFYGCTNIAVINEESSFSGKAVTFISTTDGGIYQRNGGDLNKSIPFENGENLVISGCFKVTSGAYLRIGLEGTSYYKSFTPVAPNTWTRFEIKAIGNGKATTFTLYGVKDNRYTIKEIKVEKGNKATDWTPAPEDTEKLVVDSVKVVDTKINNVSNELTQTKNSLQASINSVSSKTNSIETTLNGKATKQEVTNVNNRVTTITADLSGITNRVSNTESRVNTLNGQVQNAVTKNEFTEYKQNSDNFKWKVEKGYGGNNILRDTTFRTVGVDEDIWYDIAYSFQGNNTSYTKWGDGSEWIMNGTFALVVRGQHNTNKYGEYAVRQDIKLKPNTNYTLTCLVAAHRGDAHIHIYDKDYSWLAHKEIKRNEYWGGKNKSSWCKVELHFTTNGDTEQLKESHIDLTVGACDNDSYCIFCEPMLCEGELAQAFQPNNYEIYGTTMLLNEDKLQCCYTDKSYIQMGKDGFEWWKNGMKHPYHCLMARGSVDKVNSGQTVRIWLPEVFRGKEYEIGWWTGNVFPANPADCLFAVNTELTRQNKNEGWFEVKMSVMVRNPNKESNPQWRGKANVVWIAIA